MIEPQASFPLYVVEDLTPQQAFYESVFGFRTVFFDTGFYLHLHHVGSDAQLGFLLPDHPTQPSFLMPLASTDGAAITMEVADALAASGEAERMGLEIVFEYKFETWGQRHFMLRDPAGLVVDIVERQAP